MQPMRICDGVEVEPSGKPLPYYKHLADNGIGKSKSVALLRTPNPPPTFLLGRQRMIDAGIAAAWFKAVAEGHIIIDEEVMAAAA